MRCSSAIGLAPARFNRERVLLREGLDWVGLLTGVPLYGKDPDERGQINLVVGSVQLAADAAG